MAFLTPYADHAVNLTDLANRFGSDKGTVTGVGGPPHRYTYLYDILFAPYRTHPINLLEIGLAVGGLTTSRSVQMWLEYFDKAHIFGFDISDFSDTSEPRFTFIRGDSGSESDLRRLAQAALSFEIIIDDGSHASYHQQLAFKVLFPKLSAGGLYIIEDLNWQPDFEGNLPAVPKTAEFLTAYYENARYIDNTVLSAEAMDEFKGVTASFAHFPAFDGTSGPTKLIVLHKRTRSTRTSRAICQRRQSVQPARQRLHRTKSALAGRVVKLPEIIIIWSATTIRFCTSIGVRNACVTRRSG